jgi:prepilin-type N-terminal cleavage/methylation domain-containing protein
MHREKNKNNNGFSLIELAVVLTILSMLVTVIITIVPFKEEKESNQVTEKNLEIIEEAILAFYNQKGYIPCPSSRDAAIASSAFGVSTDCSFDDTASNINAPSFVDEKSGASDDRIRIGAVPTRDLNLPDDLAFDGWNNRITYSVTAELGINDALFNLKKPNIGIEVRDSNGTNMIPSGSTVAFVLVSHGRDGAGAWNYSGASASTCNTLNNSGYNCEVSTLFRDQFTNVDSTDFYFDDFVKWKTKAQVMTEGDYAGTGGGTTAKYALFVNRQLPGVDIARGNVQTITQLNHAVVNNTDVTFTATTLDFPAGRFILKEGHIGCEQGRMNFYRQLNAGALTQATAPFVGNAAATGTFNYCDWTIGSYDYNPGSPYSSSSYINPEFASSIGAGRNIQLFGATDYRYYDYVEVWQQ